MLAHQFYVRQMFQVSPSFAGSAIQNFQRVSLVIWHVVVRMLNIKELFTGAWCRVLADTCHLLCWCLWSIVGGGSYPTESGG